MDAGADINASHYEYGTALTEAIPASYESLTLKTLKTLLAKGADVNAFDGQYGTPLIKAVYFGFMLVVDVLLDAGADVNAGTEMYDTALNVLIQRSRFDGKMFNRLISAGADVNYKARGHASPLLTAVRHDNFYAVAELLKVGADASITGETMSSLLKIAAKQYNESIVMALLDHDLYAATEKLEIYSSPDSKKTIDETMRVLETGENIARLICNSWAERLKRDERPYRAVR